MEGINHWDNIPLLLYLIAPAVVSSVALLLIIILYLFAKAFLDCSKTSFESVIPNVSIFLSMGILGTIVGYLTGLSREPAVSALVPAALSLIGAFGIYLVSREDQKQVSVSLATVSLSVFLVLGALAGAQQRIVAERSLGRENAREVVRQEFIQRQMRNSLRLNENRGNQ